MADQTNTNPCPLAVMDAGADALAWPAAGMERRKKAANNLREARAKVAELVTKSRAMLPSNVCLDNTNVPDSTEVPLLATMGELRALRAALSKFRSAP